MRAVIQRVSSAAVTVSDEQIASIGSGLLALVGVAADDDDEAPQRLARKTARLRIFGDDEGKMNLSVTDVSGEVLVVSQFTLYGDASKGNRPSFISSASPEIAEPLIDSYVEALRAEGLGVATGRFRAHMEVDLVNDGPVTILIDT